MPRLEQIGRRLLRRAPGLGALVVAREFRLYLAAVEEYERGLRDLNRALSTDEVLVEGGSVSPPDDWDWARCMYEFEVSGGSYMRRAEPQRPEDNWADAQTVAQDSPLWEAGECWRDGCDARVDPLDTLGLCGPCRDGMARGL